MTLDEAQNLLQSAVEVLRTEGFEVNTTNADAEIEVYDSFSKESADVYL